MANRSESMQDHPLPPASFTFLVESLLMQTQIQLGLLKLGGENENPEPNLPLARHSIDLLAVLQEKTRGNLTVEEQRLLDNGLTELRFRYVQVADELRAKNQSKAAAQTAGSSANEPPRIILSDGGKGTKTE
jgi:hypothetical protein